MACPMLPCSPRWGRLFKALALRISLWQMQLRVPIAEGRSRVSPESMAFRQMEAIQFNWRLLLLLMLAAQAMHSITIAAVGGNADGEEADLDLDEKVGWKSESLDDELSPGPLSRSRLLGAKKPHKSASNCARNDTNVAACCKLARNQSRNSDIQCCKYDIFVPFGVPRPFNTPSGCADLRSDPSFCGSCTTFCQLGQVCCNGKCIDSCCNGVCPTGETCCSGKCVALRQDALNCGSCGVACGVGELCCNAVCTGVLHDELNCGACAQGCFDRCCDGVCIFTMVDRNHCGSCSNTAICPPDTPICCAGNCYNSTAVRGIPCDG